jgi:hypothetical protein
VYVVLAMDLYRTKVFKEENLVLSTFQNPFTKEPSLVFGTALSDPAGYPRRCTAFRENVCEGRPGSRTTRAGLSSTARER